MTLADTLPQASSVKRRRVAPIIDDLGSDFLRRVDDRLCRVVTFDEADLGRPAGA